MSDDFMRMRPSPTPHAGRIEEIAAHDACPAAARTGAD